MALGLACSNIVSHKVKQILHPASLLHYYYLKSNTLTLIIGIDTTSWGRSSA